MFCNYQYNLTLKKEYFACILISWNRCVSLRFNNSIKLQSVWCCLLVCCIDVITSAVDVINLCCLEVTSLFCVDVTSMCWHHQYVLTSWMCVCWLSAGLCIDSRVDSALCPCLTPPSVWLVTSSTLQHPSAHLISIPGRSLLSNWHTCFFYSLLGS